GFMIAQEALEAHAMAEAAQEAPEGRKEGAEGSREAATDMEEE
ncbi:hypothetical protein Tco_1308352, partial [Tanacetum coccineum]